MTTMKGPSFRQSRTEQHLRWLNQLDDVALTNNICNICHCDCYNNCEKRNENDNLNDCATTCRSHSLEHVRKKREKNAKSSKSKTRPQKIYPSQISESLTTAKQDTTIKSDICDQDVNGLFSPLGKKYNKRKKRRSKSMDVSQNQKCTLLSDCYHARDCDILHELLNSINEEDQQLINIPTDVNIPIMCISTDSLCKDKVKRPRSLCSQRIKDIDVNNNLAPPIRLSKSIANLCLLPAIRDAYLEIPIHDKRILNRMAAKRTEQAIDKENSWLAQKYWENERYERELLKCEQMEEYKKAIRDKHFQDYLKTKARFNEIAQRDLIELQRLKDSIHQKELRTKKRLNTIHTERKNAVKQKHYEEFRKAQAVNLQQAENQLDNIMRKNMIFQRLSERLQRADKLRNELLQSHLKRLRYNNYIEQLQHEELWREVQMKQQTKCEQLKATIARKRCRSQQFLSYRQKHMDASRRKATISQNLRELIRSSISPDTSTTLPICGISGLRSFTANDIYSTNALSKSILHDLDTTNSYDKSPVLTL